MIKAPRWCKDATPTTKGWVKNGELLVARKFTQTEIDDYIYHNTKRTLVVDPAPEPVIEVVQVEEAPSMLHEAPVNNTRLDKMTKRELIALGEQFGIQLSMSSTKAELINTLEEIIEEM